VKNALDDYRLEDIGKHHLICAEVFVPFVIQRLMPDFGETEAVLAVKLRGFNDDKETRKSLRLWWSAASKPEKAVAVQEKVRRRA
jgi:hypothetical protein